MATGSGRTNQSMAVLVALLIGLGGWNYYQNRKLENALPRPYKSYSDAELEQLIPQYQGEVDHQTERYREVASRKVTVRDGSLLGDRVNEFERVQQISQGRREAANRVTDNQIALNQIALEQSKRNADRPIYKMIFRRLFTFQSI